MLVRGGLAHGIAEPAPVQAASRYASARLDTGVGACCVPAGGSLDSCWVITGSACRPACCSAGEVGADSGGSVCDVASCWSAATGASRPREGLQAGALVATWRPQSAGSVKQDAAAAAEDDGCLAAAGEKCGAPGSESAASVLCNGTYSGELARECGCTDWEAAHGGAGKTPRCSLRSAASRVLKLPAWLKIPECATLVYPRTCSSRCLG